jgi:tripartite-type tricarboxylate transporter receptor subunit TctC
VNEFVPGYVIDAWYGIWAPSGTDPEVIARLSQAWQKVAKAPEVVERLTSVSAIAVGSSAEELKALTAKETAMWGDVVKSRNIKPAQ